MEVVKSDISDEEVHCLRVVAEACRRVNVRYWGEDDSPICDELVRRIARRATAIQPQTADQAFEMVWEVICEHMSEMAPWYPPVRTS